MYGDTDNDTVIYDSNYESDNDSITSPLATMIVTESLMQARDILSNEGLVQTLDTKLEKSLNWIQTQEFNNTEYIARQIVVLSHAGMNCDLLLEKLMTFKNDDGGWGENNGYKTNPTDTIWAVRALLSAGYMNDEVIQKALSVLISHTSKDPESSQDTYRWSTFHPALNGSVWENREDSSIITAYVYETLKEHNDYLESLFPITYDSNFLDFGSTPLPTVSEIEELTNDGKTFLETQLATMLDNDSPIQEKAIVTSALRRYNSTNATVNGAISENENDSISALESLIDNEGSCLSDPYLTGLILKSIYENSAPIPVISNISISQQCIDVDISTNWNDICFYVKKRDELKFVSFDSKTNTTGSLTEIVSETIPFTLSDEDKYAVLVDNRVWQEAEYSSSGIKDIAIYNKDLRLLDCDGEIIQNNAILSSTEAQTIYIQQKIHNLSKTIVGNITMSVNSSQGSTLKLLPYARYSYSQIFTVPANTKGSVNITVSADVSGDPDNDNNSAATILYIINTEFENESTNITLGAPTNLTYNVLNDNTIQLSWQAPLDQNVFGYQLATYDNDTQATEFFATTLQTSAKYTLTTVPETIRVYSLDNDSKRSLDCASLYITATKLENNDSTDPYVMISSPVTGHLISTIKDNDSGSSYKTLSVFGTVSDDLFGSYQLKLIDSQSNEFPATIPNSTIPVINGFLGSFDLDNESITSGTYTLQVTATDLANNSKTGSISIKIYKWDKNSIFEGNYCAAPSWNPDSVTEPELVFCSTKLSSTSNDDDYTENLWKWDDGGLTQFTDTFVNDMEPAWFDNDSIVFASYRYGARNLVIQSSQSENIINVLYDLNFNHYFEDAEFTLLDAEGNQEYYQKSFYNPDCKKIGNTKYIIASDELGELVMLVTQDYSTTGIEYYSLTLDLTDNDGKNFILADNPSIYIDDDNKAKILFEGYTLELPKNYQEENYYINSDIYSLEFNPPPFNVSETQLGNSQIPSTSPNNFMADNLFAFGPYTAQYDGIANQVKLYIARVDASSIVEIALYLDNDGDYPGEKLEQTYARTFATTSTASTETFQFENDIEIHKDQTYWLVVHCNSNGIQTKWGSGDTRYWISGFSSLPDEFPYTNNTSPHRVTIYIDYQTSLFVSLHQVTDTQNESEKSPIHLSSSIKSIFGVDIAYTSDKDLNDDGKYDSNIYFANSEILPLSGSPITNATTESDGVLDGLDFKNSRLSYEETFINDNDTPEHRIWYFEMQ
ncbi:MAG: hypothetical protein C4541_04050 [Candidatus Auribacter fodinae]|jgi:hypothetical protein|uniref:Fibronectin type-III domain-containing protein n=1 Tax=Candidatus Auribacter fodinae TaxID=2093366 RepID=A0A3A4R618_9BACT|nr:MAG: hypothetical protein C4541_04050 [Candidatus Auribacter fodinae]